MAAAAAATPRIRAPYGFGGPGAIALFVVGLAAVVLGALVLADGVLDYAGNATVFLGSVGWSVNLALGVVAVAAGAVVIALSRRVSW